MRISYPINALSLVLTSIVLFAPASAYAYFSFGYYGNGLHVGVGQHGSRVSIGHYGRHNGFRLGYFGHSRHPFGSHYYGNSRRYSRYGYSRHHGSIYYGRNYPNYNRSYYPGQSYRGNSSYSYGSHYYPSQRTTTYRNSYHAPNQSSTNSSSMYSNQHVDYNAHGWNYLASGNAAQALNSFGLAAEQAPNYAGPKVGYALAQSVGGDYGRGAWAMRRAIAADPYSLRQISIDSGLSEQLHGIIYAYDSGHRNGDHAFVTAALAYMANDKATAQRAIRDARKYGDRSAEARKLKKLIAGM